MSQPFQVAQVFTGYEGKLVPLKETIRSFKEILSGLHDSLPESAFYMVRPLCLALPHPHRIAFRLELLRMPRPRLSNLPRK